MSHLLKYITKETFDGFYNDTTQISRMINGLMSYLKKSNIKGRKFKD